MIRGRVVVEVDVLPELIAREHAGTGVRVIADVWDEPRTNGILDDVASDLSGVIGGFQGVVAVAVLPDGAPADFLAVKSR